MNEAPRTPQDAHGQPGFVERHLGGARRARQFEARPGTVIVHSTDFQQWTPPSAAPTRPVPADPAPVTEVVESSVVAVPASPSPAPSLPAPVAAAPAVPTPEIVPPPPAPPQSHAACTSCAALRADIARLEQALAGSREDNRALAHLVAQMTRLDAATLPAVHAEVGRAALQVAAAIMGRVTDVDPTWLAARVTEGLRPFGDALADVRVRMNAEDHAALLRSWPGDPEQPRLEIAPELARGCFVIDGPAFSVESLHERRIEWLVGEASSP